MKRKITDQVQYQTNDEFINHYVDVYGAIFYPREFWLTEKEKAFFVEHVKLANESIPLASREAVDRLKNVFSTKDKDRSVWIYRGFLKKKKWLVQSPNGLLIPPAFNQLLDSVEFNVKIERVNN